MVQKWVKKGFMRKARKTENCICLVTETDVESTSIDKHILDRGAPLHKVMRVEGETYQQIIDRYIRYVKS